MRHWICLGAGRHLRNVCQNPFGLSNHRSSGHFFHCCGRIYFAGRTENNQPRSFFLEPHNRLISTTLSTRLIGIAVSRLSVCFSRQTYCPLMTPLRHDISPYLTHDFQSSNQVKPWGGGFIRVPAKHMMARRPRTLVSLLSTLPFCSLLHRYIILSATGGHLTIIRSYYAVLYSSTSAKIDRSMP